MIRLGLDLDGVLADFNASYRQLFIDLTGRDTFDGETDPPCWNYHAVYGYTDAEAKQVWGAIAASDRFWERLDPLPGAVSLLKWAFWKQNQIDVYFITSRIGLGVKKQSEHWLHCHGFPRATVLVQQEQSGTKGDLAKGLGLTHVLDDKIENLLSLPTGVVRCLRVARYNVERYDASMVPVRDLSEFAQIVLPGGVNLAKEQR